MSCQNFQTPEVLSKKSIDFNNRVWMASTQLQSMSLLEAWKMSPEIMMESIIGENASKGEKKFCFAAACEALNTFRKENAGRYLELVAKVQEDEKNRRFQKEVLGALSRLRSVESSQGVRLNPSQLHDLLCTEESSDGTRKFLFAVACEAVRRFRHEKASDGAVRRVRIIQGNFNADFRVLRARRKVA
jgi:hypothetical protein